MPASRRLPGRASLHGRVTLVGGDIKVCYKPRRHHLFPSPPTTTPPLAPRAVLTPCVCVALLHSWLDTKQKGALLPFFFFGCRRSINRQTGVRLLGGMGAGHDAERTLPSLRFCMCLLTSYWPLRRGWAA